MDSQDCTLLDNGQTRLHTARQWRDKTADGLQSKVVTKENRNDCTGEHQCNAMDWDSAQCIT